MVVTMAGKAIGAAKIVPPTAANTNPIFWSTLKNFGVGAFALLIKFIILVFKFKENYWPSVVLFPPISDVKGIGILLIITWSLEPPISFKAKFPVVTSFLPPISSKE